jgi:hypothetical protein
MVEEDDADVAASAAGNPLVFVSMQNLVSCSHVSSPHGVCADALSKVCDQFGLGAIASTLPNMCDATLTFLNEKAVCQEESKEEEDVENASDENTVLDSVADLLAAVTVSTPPPPCVPTVFFFGE